MFQYDFLSNVRQIYGKVSLNQADAAGRAGQLRQRCPKAGRTDDRNEGSNLPQYSVSSEIRARTRDTE